MGLHLLAFEDIFDQIIEKLIELLIIYRKLLVHYFYKASDFLYDLSLFFISRL